MQNGQYETFEQHFKNGTIIEFNFEINNNLFVRLTFSAKIANYEAQFKIIGISETFCAIDAEKILNKLMN